MGFIGLLDELAGLEDRADTDEGDEPNQHFYPFQ
jgi:hypothetical protein